MLSWGRNDSGQLGLSDTITRLTPHKVLSSSKFVSVACGSRTTLGVSSSGNILGMGTAVAKVLGEEVEDDSVTIPRALEGLEHIIHVATRGSHALALDNQGRVFTWGRGEQDYQNITRPTLVPLRGIQIKLIGAGRMHSVAVDDAGALYTWGSSDEGQTGLNRPGFVPFPTLVTLPGPVTKLSCGSRHTLIVVKGQNGGVMGFGGNSYSQLGLGDKEPRFAPSMIQFRPSPDAEMEIDWGVACGYRHSFIYSTKDIYGFGWNSNYQCSPSNEAVVSLPTRIEITNATGVSDPQHQIIVQVAGGGRHTLVLLQNQLNESYSLVAFGRSLSGELGIPRYVAEARKDPVLVLILTNTIQGEFPKAACGWEHSVVTIAGGRVNAPSFSYSWFSSAKGDIDAALAQLVNCMVLLRLVPSPARLGVGKTVILSNILFALWAYRADATALPHGLNTVALFAIQMGAFEVMINKYPEDPSRALGACFFCTVMLGIFQALSAYAVAPLLKRHVPRSALSASVGGVALAFITTRFMSEIFASPRAGMSSLLVLLIGFGARERMPFGVPVAFVALFIGLLVADSTQTKASIDMSQVNDDWFPLSITQVMLDGEYYPLLLSVVLPLLVVNVVNDLACIEQARASGDQFKGTTGLVLDAIVTLVGAIVFRNPFPTCIYVGHSSYKAMGATFSYSLLNALLVAGLVYRFPVQFVTIAESIPQVATVGILVWIGSVVTAEAFKNRKHGVAVVIALVPALAAWKTNGSTLEENIQPGMKALGEGYMLVSMILGAVVAQILDRKFKEAALWLLFASVLSFLGWIHMSSGRELAEGYFVSSVIAGLWAIRQRWEGEAEADLEDDDGDGLKIANSERTTNTSTPPPSSSSRTTPRPSGGFDHLHTSKYGST